MAQLLSSFSRRPFVKCLGIALCLTALTAAPLLSQDAARGSEGGEGPGSVVVVNTLERVVSVWINGDLEGHVEPGDEVRFPNVPSGRLRLQAGGVGSGGPVAMEQRTLAPGETFTWTLYPVVAMGEEKGAGTVVLLNALAEVVDVQLGGRPAGSLAPGARRAYPRVVVGEVKCEARSVAGETLAEHTLEVRSGRIARWTIGGRAPEGASPQKASTPRAPKESTSARGKSPAKSSAEQSN
jgi:hypothetical protein